MVSKKAQLKFLAGLIIALVGAGVIFSVFFFDSQEKDDKEAELFCMSSLKLRANLVLQVGDAKITSAPLLCKTLDKKVTGEEEDIKEQLAYLMARCWKIFGEGTYEEILEADNLRNLFNIAQAGNDCFMCYSAQIDESDIDISKNEMFRYLVENEHRNMNTNYIDYFQDYGGPGNVVINDDIKGDHLYGVVSFKE